MSEPLRGLLPSTMIATLSPEERRVIAAKNWRALSQILKSYGELERFFHEQKTRNKQEQRR
jgi:hypothetical protein